MEDAQEGSNNMLGSHCNADATPQSLLGVGGGVKEGQHKVLGSDVGLPFD